MVRSTSRDLVLFRFFVILVRCETVGLCIGIRTIILPSEININLLDLNFSHTNLLKLSRWHNLPHQHGVLNGHVVRVHLGRQSLHHCVWENIGHHLCSHAVIKTTIFHLPDLHDPDDDATHMTHIYRRRLHEITTHNYISSSF